MEHDIKRLYFLLPAGGGIPVGGFKVVYEYANRFANDGYSVNILYPALLDTDHYNIFQKIRRMLFFLKSAVIKKRYSCKSWFQLDTRVNELWVYHFNANIFRQNDSIIATAAETAVFLMNTNKIKTKKMYYLIQNYENWVGEELLTKTLKCDGLKKIVISPWLLDIVKKHNQNAELVENGLDFDYFKLTNPIENRSPCTLAMLFHPSENKGCKYAFEALDVVKDKFPDLRCLIFGVFAPPPYLPDWYIYYQKPDKETHNMIYNAASIFVAPALMEGMALTPAEAMQCGCAVAATDIGGYTVTCKNNETALVCEPANAHALAADIIKLITDDTLRKTIAYNGNAFIRQFTWEKAYGKFKHFIENS